MASQCVQGIITAIILFSLQTASAEETLQKDNTIEVAASESTFTNHTQSSANNTSVDDIRQKLNPAQQDINSNPEQNQQDLAANGSVNPEGANYSCSSFCLIGMHGNKKAFYDRKAVD